MLTMMKMADVSTVHVTKEDSTQLEVAAVRDVQTPIDPREDFPLRVLSTMYGFVVFCRDKDSLDEVLSGLEKHGMSAAFRKLYEICVDEGAFAINLDCDAETYENLEAFQW